MKSSPYDSRKAILITSLSSPGFVKAIEIRDLVKVYSKSVRAVDGVSFDVDEGIVFGLLGPNGAGKTTIIKMIVTLLTITEGHVSVLGHERPREDYGIRTCIGYVPQDVSSDAALTGYENLLISAKLYGHRGKAARELCENILKELGLWEAKDRVVKTYSGGMIRKLEIGQAMVHDPKVLILDEPTIGLDPVARKQVWASIKELKERTKMTVIITTHYMEEADQLCDMIAIMSIGKIATIGTPAELKASAGTDYIILEVRGNPPDIPGAKIENGTIMIPSADCAKELPGYVARVASSGCEVLSARVKEVTLEDAFVKHVGTRIDEMDQWSNVKKTRRVARRMG
jgi:ABC-2 type transport system ATP-binding protein